MDTSTLTSLATATYTALQPYLTVLAVKATEKIGEQIPAEVNGLWNTLRERFARKPSAQESLKDLLTNPDDPDLQAAFRVQLKKLLQDDAEFANELRHLVETVGTQPNYRAELRGSGAIAQGPGAKAMGAGSTMINVEKKED